jgi:hypothetical protein
LPQLFLAAQNLIHATCQCCLVHANPALDAFISMLMKKFANLSFMADVEEMKIILGHSMSA